MYCGILVFKFKLGVQVWVFCSVAGKNEFVVVILSLYMQQEVKMIVGFIDLCLYQFCYVNVGIMLYF